MDWVETNSFMEKIKRDSDSTGVIQRKRLQETRVYEYKGFVTEIIIVN